MNLGKISTSLVWGFAVILIALAGIAYRVFASRLRHTLETPINLPIPLSAFPVQIDNWIGEDLTIPTTTKEYMEKHFADDFLSRRYVNTTTKDWADVYIVYCSSRLGGMLGHRPQVCYPGHGWIHDGTESSYFTSQIGQQIPCLIHRFHKPAPAYDQTVVLSFYILSGQVTTDETSFSGPFGRRPNIAGNPARYVAQVQISAVLESSVRKAAQEMTDIAFDFLPDENGKVRVAEFAWPSGGNVKIAE